MSQELIIGSDIESVTQEVIVASRGFASNEVVKLDKSVLNDMSRSLPPSLQKVDSLFGLRLTLQKKESMAHSGWLYSRYLETSRRVNINHKNAVAIYKDGFFREFGQFDAMESELIFLGFGQLGEKVLSVILNAESQFNPDDFDLDGYMN